VPGLSAVQGAALREILTSVALIVILRLRPQGMVPEARMHAAVKPADAGRLMST